MKKLIVSECTINDALEYSAVLLNVKTSSRLKVEGKCQAIFIKKK